jgi:leader peptidase (prepilin peptidase)/N-methyltransferase
MRDLYHFVREQHAWVLELWIFALGACVGSFLNVCVLRIPAGKSIVRPGSHCACGKPIRWFDNIPILSWFLLRGRARCCGAAFSFRYPLVEAVTAGVFLWLWSTMPLSVAAAGMVFFSLLFMGALIDLDHMILPDASTVWGMLIGVLLSFVWPQIQIPHFTSSGWWLEDGLQGWVSSIIGVLVGTGVVFWMRELGELILKKEAMGYGDILLMGCIGAFCGWQGALFAIFGGAVIGCLVILPWMLFAKIFKKPDAGAKTPLPAENAPAGNVVAEEKAKDGAGEPGEVDEVGEEAPATPAFGVAIPFGPWLALAGFLYYAWMWPWVDAYFNELKAIVYATPIFY